MTHLVTSTPHICPRCEKLNSGAAVSIMKHLVCPKCYYDGFEKDIRPIINKMINDYFQPERLSGLNHIVETNEMIYDSPTNANT